MDPELGAPRPGVAGPRPGGWWWWLVSKLIKPSEVNGLGS